MKTAQEVVKWLAISFAVLLMCGILMAIISAGTLAGVIIGNMTGHDTFLEDGTTEVIEIAGVNEESLDELYVNVKATSVLIERGNEFKIEANEDVITVRRGENALYIEEKDFNFFTDWGTRDEMLRITIPDDWDELEVLLLEAGAGRVSLADLEVRDLKLDLGAGKTELERVVVSERAKINGGAGHLSVRDAQIKNLDFEMGVGKAELTVQLSGENEIEAGVGKLELALRGEMTDYQIEMSHGLGSMTLNGQRISDDTVRGDGENVVRIDGGVGAIEIRTE